MFDKRPLTRMLGTLSVVFTLCLLMSSPAQAVFPEKPLRIVVPFAPGGSTDQMARLLAQLLVKEPGVQVIVENRPGANTILAAGQIARGASDGYNLFVAAGSTVVLSPLLYRKLPFDPAKDFNMLSVLGEFPLIAVVRSDNPAKTLPEFFAYAKAKPGGLNFGSPGTGSTLHMGGEMLKQEGGFEATHAAYKISAQALMDVLGGQLDFMMADHAMAVGEIANGRLRALAVTSDQRLTALPDIPTVAEFFPGFRAIVWYGLVVQKDTPEPIAIKIKAMTDKALATREYQEGMVKIGFVPSPPMSHGDVQKYLAAENERWSNLIRARNIKIEE
jgi:tripartite-type tricarboxylate transporter receptor subunit TctC